MPYEPHRRLTMTGIIGGNASDPDERFSMGIAIEKRAVGPEMDNDQFDDLVADCAAFFGRAATGINPYCKLTQVKYAWIGADGKYTRDPMIEDVDVPGGLTGGIRYPPQISLAVSLVTERRGPSGKGRFYLPGVGLPVAPDSFNADDGAINAVRGSVVQFLDAVNNEPNTDILNHQVVVASTKGFLSGVTGVRVGRALDTVRSRRRSIPELYGTTQNLSSNN